MARSDGEPELHLMTMVRLRRQGWSMREIAKEMGCCHQNVVRRLKRYQARQEKINEHNSSNRSGVASGRSTTRVSIL